MDSRTDGYVYGLFVVEVPELHVMANCTITLKNKM